VIIITVII